MLNIGDLVEVLKPAEIMKTLDAEGKLENLPFMPEMLPYCGKRFRIKSIVDNTCAVNMSIRVMREFKYNNVVSLDDLRCDGSAHDGCQVCCTLFWKKAWLKKVDTIEEKDRINLKEENEMTKILKTKLDSSRYLCQVTSLLYATEEITKLKKLFKLFKKAFAGRISFIDVVKTIWGMILRKLKITKSYDAVFKGNLKRTPSETLNLQPGEIVEVKSYNEILKTLDIHGNNKGLLFNSWNKESCGKRIKVRSRVEHMIDETTGKMREIKDTVYLEDSVCQGCSRAQFNMWREIWLKRV